MFYFIIVTIFLQFQPPFDTYKYVGVRIDPVSGVVDIRDEPIFRGVQPRLQPVGRNGVRGQLPAPQGELAQPNVIPYFSLPENYHGNQLKSYGGYLRYTIRYEGYGAPLNAPNVILTVSIVHCENIVYFFVFVLIFIASYDRIVWNM